VNRGEIWTLAGGVYAAKPYPAVLVQDDLFDATSSVRLRPPTWCTRSRTWSVVPACR